MLTRRILPLLTALVAAVVTLAPTSTAVAEAQVAQKTALTDAVTLGIRVAEPFTLAREVLDRAGLPLVGVSVKRLGPDAAGLFFSEENRIEIDTLSRTSAWVATHEALHALDYRAGWVSRESGWSLGFPLDSAESWADCVTTLVANDGVPTATGYLGPAGCSESAQAGALALLPAADQLALLELREWLHGRGPTAIERVAP